MVVVVGCQRIKKTAELLCSSSDVQRIFLALVSGWIHTRGSEADEALYVLSKNTHRDWFVASVLDALSTLFSSNGVLGDRMG